MRRIILFLSVWALAAAFPVIASAQAMLTGTVKDSSGAVLPGVTVEATSPALIEKMRTAITDGSGQYRVVDLRSGEYAVTFTLAGFKTYKQDGVKLSGTGTFTVNAELGAGAVAETITVTANMSVVDVQSVTQQRVVDRELLDAIPSGRTVHNVAALIPGMVINVTGPVSQDVGGSTVGALQQASIHGGRAGDQRVMMDGLPLSSTQGNLSGFISNIASTQEFTVDISGVSAEDNAGGVRMNVVPREGGNRFTGSAFFTGATGDFQSSNYDADLQQRGFAAPNPPKTIDRTHDINVSLGGPISRDRLWFYTAYNWHADEGPLNGRQNLNASDPSNWLYVPDPNTSIPNGTDLKGINFRLTSQLTTKNKVAFFIDRQDRCRCPEGDPFFTKEAEGDSRYPGQRFLSVTWTSVLSTRLVLDAAFLNRYEKWGDFARPGQDLNQIQVVDVGLNNQTYHGQGQLTVNENLNNNLRGALSFVTGAHAFKTGGMGLWGRNQPSTTGNAQNLLYTFNNGVPQSLTMYANPTTSDNRITDWGVFVQDRWTIDRLTLSGGLRFDYLRTWFPSQSLGPGAFLPNRNISAEETVWVTWTDVTPRMGAAYDLFGTGKTAVRVSLNKYLGAQNATGQFGSVGNPLNRVASTTNRNWNDLMYDVGDPRRGNFVPDCDLLNPVLNGECAGYSNTAFGTVTPTTSIDPELSDGFGVRFFNWEFQASVQQQLMSRVSMEFAYVRRWYGNFTTTDNRLLGPADFDSYTINAPTDPRLEGGGGYALPTLVDVKPAKFGLTDNLVTLAKNYGDQIERWHGVDLTFNVRFADLTFQGGMSTGSTLTDRCEVQAALPEIATGALGPYCRQQTKFLTQVKGLVSYTYARWDVSLSAGFQSLQGPQISSNWNAPNSVIAPELGRSLSGGAANRQVNLVAPGTSYQPRSNQVDLRVGKTLRFGARRALIAMDLFNAFNANPVLGQNNTYGTAWLTPTFVLPGRLAKFSMSFDF